MENIRKEIKKQIEHLVKATFVAVDLGVFSGVIYINSEIQDHSDVLSKLYQIDSILSEQLEADILDTNIAITYGDNKLRVIIRFDYED